MLKIRRLFLITLSCALAPLSFAETDINPNFIYLYKGHKMWEGSHNEIMMASVKELKDFIFASELMKKLKALR